MQSQNSVTPLLAQHNTTPLSLVKSVLQLLHARSSRVHALTNVVAANLTANTILALGSVPSMTDYKEEIPQAIETSDALLVNLGTPDKETAHTLQLATEIAVKNDKPWVLDPVFVERFSERLQLAERLFPMKPSIIRGNHGEIRALLACCEDVANNTNPAEIAIRLADTLDTVVVSTGEQDIITDGISSVSSTLGHSLQTLTTGMGCALGAMLTTVLARHPILQKENIFTSALAGAVLAGGVATKAGEKSKGPGSFQVEFLDMLYHLSHQQDTETLLDVFQSSCLSLPEPL